MIKIILAKINKSRFIRNVALVSMGMAGAQIITIAFSPIITRLYGPEAFGLLGAFMAALTVLTPLSALAYPTAIVIAKNDIDAIGLAKLSIFISILISGLISVLLYIAGKPILEIFGIQKIDEYLYFIPIAMLFTAWHQIIHQWLIRKQEFNFLAKIAVMQALIINAAKAGFGWLNPVGAVLILVTIGGFILHVILLSSNTKKMFFCYVKKNEYLSKLKGLALLYKDFPLYRAPQNAINAISQSLPILMLAIFFGPESAGFYTLSKMVMGMPIGLVGQAFMDVFYPKITEAAHKKQNVHSMIVKSTLVMFSVGVLPFSIVVVFGPVLFGFVFGAEWIVSGEYAQWLAVFFFFNFINKPCVAVIPVIGLQRGLLIYEIFSTCSKILALFLGFYWFKSDIWAIALFSIFGAIAYIMMICWILNNTRKRRQSYG